MPGRAFKLRIVKLNLPLVSSSPTLPANICSSSPFNNATLLFACAIKVYVWLIALRGTSNLNTLMLSPPHAYELAPKLGSAKSFSCRGVNVRNARLPIYGNNLGSTVISKFKASTASPIMLRDLRSSISVTAAEVLSNIPPISSKPGTELPLLSTWSIAVAW